MEEEKREDNKIVLTKPFFSSNGDSSNDYRPPNFIERIFSLIKNIRIGSDLTTMQATACTFQHTQITITAQLYGETVYSINSDVLRKCNNCDNSRERFIAVLAWCISTLQPMIFGTGPYNSIIGETHHISRGSLNVLLEQVSHHPPVSALHATDEKDNLEILWCVALSAKYYGTFAQVEFPGKKQLKLLNHGETYAMMSSPKLSMKVLPSPGVQWTGKQRINCFETGFEAELTYGGSSLLGLKGNPRSVKGKIIHSSSSKPLFSIDGNLNEVITLTDLSSDQTRVIYDTKEAISRLNTPVVRDRKGIWASESALIWSEVTQGILNKDWANATIEKKIIEENKRKLARERKSRGESWAPKHFSVSYSKEGGWDCSPIQKIVPQAPIIVPIDS